MPARLLYRDALGNDAAVDLPESAPAYLGRGTDCLVRAEDPLLSRRHCRVVGLAGRFHLEDLGSANGTFVNDERVKRHALAHGDVIRCGSLKVRFIEVAPVVEHSRTEEIDVSSLPMAEPQPAPEELAARDQQLQALAEQNAQLEQELVELRERVERTADYTRLGHEAVARREELSAARRAAERDREELAAANRRAEELIAEAAATKAELSSLREKGERLAEDLAVRDRQLGRAQDEVQAARRALDELRAKVSELQKTKDEGWRE